MSSKPVAELPVNSFAMEVEDLVKPTGFREYDARWWFGHPNSDVPPELNLNGVRALGLGIATVMHELGVEPDIVTGHDYRSYSASIKMALINGLMSGGCRVRDIGLALSPMAYYAQFALECPAVAMVTASHNENGWTGVKMGADRPLTFGPDEMGRLRDIVLAGQGVSRAGGSLEIIDDFKKTYVEHLTDRPTINRPLKVVAACGNGTAGAFAPEVLRGAGCEVIELDCELDFTFPRYNPNPEDMQMLSAVREAVLQHGADVGLAFDGDGDRCGVVDNEGEEIFADKVGVMLARDIASTMDNARFVVDVKSTGLFASDPELRELGAETVYWKTGHSYIKRHVKHENAIAGFEKSGHYFFNPPIGLGYDDGLVSALAVCDMLDRNPDKSMADLRRALPTTYGSPTMSPKCPDETKYDVVAAVQERIEAVAASGGHFAGQAIESLVTVNGIRVVNEDGTWGLVRASSNKPELVVVVESPVSDARMREMFAAIDAELRQHSDVGAYNQTI